MASVDEKVIRRQGKFQHGIPHGHQRRLKDINVINDICFDHTDADREGFCLDELI